MVKEFNINDGKKNGTLNLLLFLTENGFFFIFASKSDKFACSPKVTKDLPNLSLLEKQSIHATE